MKLYFAKGACSLSPHIVLRELGLDFELESVDLKSKQTASGKNFYDINPLGYVPALQLDTGDILTEGPAITQFLADHFGKGNLAPENGTLERTRLQSWLNFISTEIHKSFSPLFNKSVSAEAKQLATDHLKKRFAYVDSHLAHHEFLVTQSFTVADAYLFTVITWTKFVNFEVSSYPHLMSYFSRLLGRPGIRSALDAEGLSKFFYESK